MALETWIAGQILGDLILLGLLCYVVFRLRQREVRVEAGGDANAAVHVEEVRRLHRDLEKNLAEKRTLSARILTQLDRRLASAEQTSRKLEALLVQSREGPDGGGREDFGENDRRAAITALAANGMSAAEIASILRLPLGEVTLTLKLRQSSDAT
jgi:hypothetical protein